MSHPTTVLLGGDMDALPVDEEVDVDFAAVKGGMHACGKRGRREKHASSYSDANMWGGLTSGLDPSSTAVSALPLCSWNLIWIVGRAQRVAQLIQSSVLDGSYLTWCQAECLCCVFAAQSNHDAQY